MTTAEAAIHSGDSRAEPYVPNPSWFEELAVPDFSWVVNTSSRYASMLSKIPDILAWEESSSHHENLQVLALAVAIRRFRSCLDHIGRYDRSLAKSMRTSFEALPSQGKLRFMTAPETFYGISRLRRQPVESIVLLCNYLNGEAAFQGLDAVKEDYVTALGDFYYLEGAEGCATATNGQEENSPAQAFRAPYLAVGIPADFDSPNASSAQETPETTEYVPYTAAEKLLVVEKLNSSISQIEQVSAPTAQLIKQYIKVIVPRKHASGGCGSTSQSRYPGRVLIRGVEVHTLASLTSSLVHESIHQLLYLLEWAGPFIIEDPEARVVTAKSGWTGRDLVLHQFIHACFVWYGLSTFWVRARSSEAFKASEVEGQLARSMAGFRNQNPAELLAPYAGMLRYDVLKCAGTLQSRLQDVIDQTTA